MFWASSAYLQEEYNCIHAAYGTVTLYESSWWLVGTQLEWEWEQFSLKLCTDRPPWTLSESDSTICCMYTTVFLLKMSTWGSKHVEENGILWINNNQCIKLVIKARVGTLIVATIYLQQIQNRYMFRSFTVLQCSHQHCVQPVASDVEVIGYL